MKHVFYVHSFVTYLATLGVIEHHGVKDDDVMIVTARDAISQNRFKEIDLNAKYPNLFGIPCFGYKLFFLKSWNIIRAFDRELNSFCGNEMFTCYLPSDKHFCQQLIITHKKCYCVNYIEEGLFTYNNTFRKGNWPFSGISGRFIRYINTGNRNRNPLISNDLKSKLYTLFDPSYYNTDLPIECIMPSISKIEYRGVKLQNANVLMMNAFRDASPQIVLQVLELLKKFAKDLQFRKETVYIKHHPYALESMRRQIEEVFKNSGVTYYVMEERLNTELMLFNSKNLSIYGFFSAAMLYGAMMGHKSITFMHYFESQSQECKEYLIRNFPVPPIFIKHLVNYES